MFYLNIILLSISIYKVAQDPMHGKVLLRVRAEHPHDTDADTDTPVEELGWVEVEEQHEEVWEEVIKDKIPKPQRSYPRQPMEYVIYDTKCRETRIYNDANIRNYNGN